MSREEVIETLCRPVVESMGFEWWGVEYHHNSVHSLLRVYVDKEGGIGIEDLERVTEQLNPILDVENPIAGAYTFEVSSPGLDRVLFTLEQCARYLGEEVKLQTRRAVDGQRKFSGVLSAVDLEEGTLTLSFLKAKESVERSFEFANIEKVRINPVF